MMKKMLYVSLFVAALCGATAFGMVTSATHTGSYKLSDGSPISPYGTPEILLNFSGNNVAFIKDRVTVMTGAAQGSQVVNGFTFAAESPYSLTNLEPQGSDPNWVRPLPNKPFPAYLIGGDMVRVENRNREIGDYQLTVQTDRPSYVYLIMDNRVNGTAGGMGASSPYTDPELDGVATWVAANGWVRMNTGINGAGTPDFLTMDEDANGDANQYAAIYRNVTTPIGGGVHQIVLGAQGLGNMYGVIVFPAPAEWDFSKNGVIDLPDLQTFLVQWLYGAGGTNSLEAFLAHRYTFDEGAGTTITDVIGGKNGTLIDLDDPDVSGTQSFAQWGNGYLDLLNTGTQTNDLFNGGAYISLPNSMIDALRNDNGLTFEIFFERPTPTLAWPLNDDNWRSGYFCFGQGNNPSANDEFALLSRNNENHVMVWHQDAGYYTQFHEASPKMAGNTHAAVVVDHVANNVRVYVNGVLKQTIDKSGAPWELPGMKSADNTYNDVLNFLGRAYGPNDALARVRYKAFNIYRVALTDAQVQLSYNAGPDDIPCLQDYASDLDGDCDVDIEDFALIAETWMKSYLN